MYIYDDYSVIKQYQTRIENNSLPVCDAIAPTITHFGEMSRFHQLCTAFFTLLKHPTSLRGSKQHLRQHHRLNQGSGTPAQSILVEVPPSQVLRWLISLSSVVTIAHRNRELRG